MKENDPMRRYKVYAKAHEIPAFHICFDTDGNRYVFDDDGTRYCIDNDQLCAIDSNEDEGYVVEEMRPELFLRVTSALLGTHLETDKLDPWEKLNLTEYLETNR